MRAQLGFLSTEFYMQRLTRLSVFCLGAAVAMSACAPEEVVPTENIPTGGVRFINAVPDSSGAFGLDFRFVDLVESNAHFRISFRNTPTTTSGVVGASTAQYKGARAGNRNFRIFLNDTLQNIASTVIKDSSLTVTAGENQTVIMWGPARAGQMKLSVIKETVADPGTKVALRVINATGSAIDASPYLSTGTAPATPTWANVPAYSASSYVLVDPGQYRYTIRTPGTTTTLFADQLALIGAPATSTAGAAGKLDIEPLPGTTVAGSAVTMIVFPRSTAGARTPQTAAFQVPAGAFMWDRRPPRGF
jgi:Domain of unknown function (DUF4397)